MKAVREALEALSAWVKVVKNNPKDTTAIECAEFVEETIRVALAAPPRNCDIGTAEEQMERFCKLCEMDYIPEDCPDDCPFAWGQTPYEEGGAK